MAEMKKVQTEFRFSFIAIIITIESEISKPRISNQNADHMTHRGQRVISASFQIEYFRSNQTWTSDVAKLDVDGELIMIVQFLLITFIVHEKGN